ncbi:hypothetical protein JXA63_04515 [Candidatus Woesebacteria bacterium]|nr:hypothetical protein [Candidatus Woesebacteria bacterium]
MKLLKPFKIKSIRSKKTKDSRKPIKRRRIKKRLFQNIRSSKKKKLREKEVKRRKNFIPSVIITAVSWVFTFYIILFVDPLQSGSIQIFFISIFLSLVLTFKLIFKNTRRALLTTISISIFLVLRYFGIGNIINVILILGLAITSEVYFSQKKY